MTPTVVSAQSAGGSGTGPFDCFFLLLMVVSILVVMYGLTHLTRRFVPEQARLSLTGWAAQNGFRLVGVEKCIPFLSPFWNTTGRARIYRVTVELPDGSTRDGFARVSSNRWADVLDFAWARPDQRQSAPGGFPVIPPGPHDRRHPQEPPRE